MHQHVDHIHDNSNTISKALAWGMALNIVYIAVEAATGFSANSLALLTDAGHNLSDVAGLFLSYGALKLSHMNPPERFTFGFRKSSILAALFNAVFLFVAVGAIIWEAVGRLIHPVEVPGKEIIIVAAIGILINGATTFFLTNNKDKDLNIKSAYLHMFYDTIVSAGVVVAGFLIMVTGYRWIDPLISIIVALVIIKGTSGLLRESLKLSLDAIPAGLDLQTIKDEILKIAGVKNVCHIHIWALSTTENAITAHLELSDNTPLSKALHIKETVREKLKQMNITHATLELEQTHDENKHDCK